MPKIYDLTCLLSPDFSEDAAQKFAQQIEAGLPESKIVKTYLPKMVGLSYPVKKQTTAFLFGLIFETEPEQIEKIKNNLEKEEKILRFLLINRKRLPEEPAPMVIERKASEPEPVIVVEAEPVIDEPKPAKKPVKKPTKSKKAEIADKDQEQETELKQIGDDLDEILNTPLTEN